MIKIYVYIDDPHIYGIYNRSSSKFYVSTNHFAANGIIYITD